jgi:hypothetical protein
MLNKLEIDWIFRPCIVSFKERKQKKSQYYFQYFGIKAHIFPVSVFPRDFPFVTISTFVNYTPQLLQSFFWFNHFNWGVIMTFMIQNKSVVVWLNFIWELLNFCQLVLNSVQKVRPPDCQSTICQKFARSGTLEEITSLSNLAHACCSVGK